MLYVSTLVTYGVSDISNQFSAQVFGFFLYKHCMVKTVSVTLNNVEDKNVQMIYRLKITRGTSGNDVKGSEVKLQKRLKIRGFKTKGHVFLHGFWSFLKFSWEI